MGKRGGSRPGAGRKSKSEEQKLIERLTPMSDIAYEALRESLQDKKARSWSVPLWFSYMYGKPKQQVDVTSDGEQLNSPVITFITDKDDD